jgi:PAS domain S-box-containing protein
MPESGPASRPNANSTAAIDWALGALAGLGSAQDHGVDGLARASPPPPRAPGRPGDGTERSLPLAEVRYRTLIEQIPAVTFVASLTGEANAIYVSPQIEALLGFTQEEWVSDPVLWYRQMHPGDRERVSTEFAETCLTGRPYRSVIRVLTRAGETRWVHAEAQIVRDQDGQPLFLQGVGFDVTEQFKGREARERLIREQAARAEADRERDHLRTIFARLPAAVALLRGPDHVVEYMNPLALELAPDGQEVIGRPFRDVFPEFADAVVGVLDGVLTTGRPFQAGEVRLADHRPAGDRFFSVVCQRLEDYRGPFLLAHAVDVTDQVRARQQVEEAVRLRDEFLSIAAHELKTPVTGIKSTSQLLERVLLAGQLDERRLERYITSIVRGANRLSTLTDDLLDVARIRTGRLAFDLARFDLRDLIRETASGYREHLDAHHDLRLSLPAEPCPVTADASRLDQVLLNLLDNAVKYSPSGGTIRVDLAAEAAALVLRVSDPGIGIPAESLEEIFQPFGRAPNATRDHLPGMGLGLYICRTIIERLAGTMWAESPGPDRGSTLVVSLPRANAERGADG